MTTLTDSTRIEVPAEAPHFALRRPGEVFPVTTLTTRPRALGPHIGGQSSRIWRHLRAPDGARH
jgi:hypothetical protein